MAMLAIAAVVSAQTSLGIKGGLNISNLVGDEITDKNMLVGGHVGLAADYEFMPNMAIQTGLFFTTKGAKYEGSVLGVKGTNTVRPMYLQVPIHFAYKFDVAPSTRVFIHAGPYLAYGIAGKVKTTVSVGDKKASDESSDVFGDKKLMKRFDAGLGLGAGAEFGPMVFDLGWDMGLANVAQDKGNIKNQNIYLSVGYRF